MDVASDTRSPEAAEAQLERFISQRHQKRRQTEGERLEEELWMESVARYKERERRQIRAEWRDYHESQAERHRRTLEALIAHHRTEAEKLFVEDDEPKGA